MIPTTPSTRLNPPVSGPLSRQVRALRMTVGTVEKRSNQSTEEKRRIRTQLDRTLASDTTLTQSRWWAWYSLNLERTCTQRLRTWMHLHCPTRLITFLHHLIYIKTHAHTSLFCLGWHLVYSPFSSMYHCLELVFVVQSMYRPDEEWTRKILSNNEWLCAVKSD